jgi:hypothetical protein
MSVGATGIPFLDGIDFPYPSGRNPMNVTFVDESRYVTMRSGAKRLIGDRRYRVKIKFGYDYLDADTYRALLNTLRLPTFEIQPRSIVFGDPVMPGTSPSFVVKCSSPLPVTNEAIAGALYSIDVELEGCEIFDMPQLPAACSPVKITTLSLPGGLDGDPYSQTVAATGSATVAFALVSGALPTGLTLSSAGAIYGTINVGGVYQTFNFRIRAINPCGVSERDFSIAVLA